MSDILLFNEQIVLALRAGLPLAIGNRERRSQVLSFISEINNRFTTESVEPGSNLDSTKLAFADESLPNEYRDAFSHWLHNGRELSAIGPLIENGHKRLESRWNVAKIMIPTLLITLLFSLLMPYVLSKLLSNLHRFHEINKLKNSSSLRFLDYLNSNAQVLSLLTLLPIIVLAFLWRRSLNIPRLAQPTERNRTPSDSTPSQGNSRPSLHSTALLKTAKQVQTQLASQQLARWIPIIIATLIGGAFVMLYAICIIWPLADLIYLLSMPRG